MSVSPAALQAAMAFLLAARPEDAIGLPAVIDYPALAARAIARGFDTDAAAIEQAFRTLMRMRNAQHPR